MIAHTGREDFLIEQSVEALRGRVLEHGRRLREHQLARLERAQPY